MKPLHRLAQVEKLDNMNTNNTKSHDDNPSQDDLKVLAKDSADPLPAKPKRLVLTNKQFIDYIGCLTDITSKVGKPIYKQNKLSNLIEWVLSEFCKKSNGGLIPTEINQGELRNQKIRNKKIGAKILSRAIKNLLHHKIILLHAKHKQSRNATFYKGGSTLFDLLDPVTLKKQNAERSHKKKAEKYVARGFDPEDQKTCACCRLTKSVCSFEVDDQTNLLKPICMPCVLKKSRTGIKPDGWDAAWRLWYLMIETQNDLALTELELNKIEEGGVDRLVDSLLNESEK